jgi:D-erythrulose 1-phosphate 3-epimerase
MTKYSLGINTCFAVKRWPLPQSWAEIVRDQLGLDLVQHSLDLVDLDAGSRYRATQADSVLRACATNGIQVHSTFTGLAAYSSNLLLHPDAEARRRAEAWFGRAIEFTARAGAQATGGHVGALTVPDWEDAGRSRKLNRMLGASLARLAHAARDAGLEALLIENLAPAREPSTMEWVDSLLSDGGGDRVPVRLCLDVGHLCTPGTSGDERDPYAWLRRFGRRSPVIHLQQSDASADHHWPFTPEANAAGRIEASRVLQALNDSGAEDVALILEVIPAFEADDRQVIRDLQASVAYWRDALAR